MSAALVTIGLVRKLTWDNKPDAGWRSLHDNTLGQHLARLQDYVDPKLSSMRKGIAPAIGRAYRRSRAIEEAQTI